MLHLYTFLTSMLVERAERDDKGATATEYALIVAGIALVVLLAVRGFGSQLSSWFSSLGGSLQGN